MAEDKPEDMEPAAWDKPSGTPHEPAAHASVPGKGALRGNLGCIAAFIAIAVIIALIYGMNYGG